jgi:hypothetical protein
VIVFLIFVVMVLCLVLYLVLDSGLCDKSTAPSLPNLNDTVSEHTHTATLTVVSTSIQTSTLLSTSIEVSDSTTLFIMSITVSTVVPTTVLLTTTATNNLSSAVAQTKPMENVGHKAVTRVPTLSKMESSHWRGPRTTKGVREMQR